MLDAVLQILKALVPEIAKAALKSGNTACKGLLRLYTRLDEVSDFLTEFHDLFRQYADRSRADDDLTQERRRLQLTLKELVTALSYFENQLRATLVSLDLLDSTELSLRLVQIPESSYGLFKTHLFRDISPQLVGGRAIPYAMTVVRASKTQTLIRKNEIGHVSINLDQLFSTGALSREWIQIDEHMDVDAFLAAILDNLANLDEVKALLSATLRANCNIATLI